MVKGRGCLEMAPWVRCAGAGVQLEAVGGSLIYSWCLQPVRSGELWPGRERGQRQERGGLGVLQKNKDEGGAAGVQGGPLLWVYCIIVLAINVSSSAALRACGPRQRVSTCPTTRCCWAYLAVSPGPTAVHQFTARLDTPPRNGRHPL
jgi:hypothetical protein